MVKQNNLACAKGFAAMAMLWLVAGLVSTVWAQPTRWQQQIGYKMNVQLDVVTNKLQGSQDIKYTNNSPDTLNRLFFHMYWNAFQPGSSMDVRSQELGKIQMGTNRDGTPRWDWDGRVRDRIGNLKPDEIGYTRFTSVMAAGKPLQVTEHETIAEVKLEKPLLPGQTIALQTRWEGQVPVQIRRSGRDNAEGVRYTMTQWYPKMAAYDKDGWHPNPYIAREFYGVWGDFDVQLTLDKTYKIGSSGVLQNAAEIGWGYDKEGSSDLKPVQGPTRTWKFRAQNVHDFAWAADPGYKHITRTTNGGPLLHFIYKDASGADRLWKGTADTCAMAYDYIRTHYGPYPWPVYSFIQGGDGGMEYAMATMIRSHSLGTAIHEWMHSWYQQLLGTNESLHAWMDEGFTSFAESRVLHHVRQQKGWDLRDDYAGYLNLARSRFEEPLTIHADHYNTNFGYSAAAYAKGAVFLGQLGYILGEATRDSILLEYYRQWKFKSPNPDDFVRVAEKVSGIELDWYKEYWVYSTKTIDYKIDSVWQNESGTNIRVYRSGAMPMPVGVTVTFKDGSRETHYIPLNLMYGSKPAEGEGEWISYPAQRWTHRSMVVTSKKGLKEVASVEIDASQRMADIDRRNNRLEIGL
ncbi:MAG: M1 family metallopeptidase [Chitinophagaceae bacterium]|nr:M1 family metallopeptidase [Chitinophagaceae bacterium]